MCSLNLQNAITKLCHLYRHIHLETCCRYVHVLRRERLTGTVFLPTHRPLSPTKPCLFGPVNDLVNNNQFGFVSIRHKSSRKKSKQVLSDSDTESDSEEEEDEVEDIDEELFSNKNVDGHTEFRYMKVHSLRALSLIAKGLGESTNAMQKKFYQSKVLQDGSVLLKKGLNVIEGSVLDLVIENSGNSRKVKRVEIVKISDKQTRKGKPIVYVKVWRKPFEVDVT